MHRIFPDGTVFFADFTGLTRWPAKGKAKHFAKAAADPCTGLSFGGAPLRVGLHNAQGAGAFLSLDGAKLEPLVRSKRSSPYGLDPRTGALLVTDEEDAEGHPHRVVSLEHDAAATALAPLALGGDRAVKGGALRSVDRGFLLDARGEPNGPWHVALRSLAGEGARFLWRAPITLAPRALLMVALVDEAAWLYSWSPRTREAHVVRVDAAGARSAVQRVQTLGRLAFDRDAFVYQADEGTVVRHRLDGVVERFAVPATAARSGLAQHGPGEVLAGEGRVLFVPWHREALLDLASGAVYDRPLPAKLAPLLRAFAAWAREERREGSWQLALQDVKITGDRVAYSSWAASGEPTGFAREGSASRAALDAVSAAQAALGLRLGASGSIGSYASDE